MPRMTRREVLTIAAASALAACAREADGRGSPLMSLRPIPSTGETIPVIGLGTWQTFDVGASAAERAPLEEVLRRLVDAGGRVLDSSPMYGRSEEVAGALAKRLGLRDRLFVATKVWTRGREEGIAQMERSRRLFGGEPLDLIEVHNLLDARTHLRTLRAWKDEGKVRYLGVTHYHAGAHAEVEALLKKEPLDFVQINFSVAEPEAGERLLAVAAERGVAVIANRPFGGGDLFRRLRSKPLPEWAGSLGCDSWAQLLLKWILGHPAVTCAIPATRNPKHMEDNARAGSGPMPDAVLRRRIAEAVR